jgi:hypothetical protein
MPAMTSLPTNSAAALTGPTNSGRRVPVPPLQVSPAGATRRGVLLLVVLSMLTLFLMLGAAYLLAASRAREAARAYARLTFGSDEARIPAPALLDSVFLRVVRGPIVIGSNTFESLLADKYGSPASGAPTLSGSLSSVARIGPALTGSLATSSSVRPTDLVGRVLTIAQPGTPVTSHRIVRAINSGSTNAPGTAFTLALDLPLTGRPFTLPSGSVPIIVNGREFSGAPSINPPISPPSNENWDGFDDHNLFLAQLKSSTSSISRAEAVRGSFLQGSSPNTFSVPTVSGTSFTLTTSATSPTVFLVTGTTDFDNDLIMDAADNDGDGVIDGIYQNIGLPDVTDAAGNAVNLRASILVVDLDGRFNVNAHDALPRLIYAGTNRWTTTVATTNAPMGSGYGPAEISGHCGGRVWTGNTTATSGSTLFPGPPGGASLTTTSTFSTSEHPTVLTLTGGDSFRGLRSATSSRYNFLESTWRLQRAEGRYGERAPSNWSDILGGTLTSPSSASFAVPGVPAIDDESGRITDRRALPSEPADVNFGTPPVWWDVTSGSTFNWFARPTVSGTALPAPRGTFNSPPDLHGRMKTITRTATAFAPVLTFAKAEWADAAAGGGRESTDDPYELRLDTRSGRGGMLFDPTTAGSTTSASSLARDNPFTPAELESVLRPYDVDTNTLPPRLAAMLGSVAEESRLKVTTDSWDTTAITGSAAVALFGTQSGSTGWLQSGTFNTLAMSGSTPIDGIIGGEVARGERFDLNRPLAASGTANAGYDAGNIYYRQRQAYFKDLYTLLFALDRGSGGATPAAEIAQWVANAIEFRDADSVMTPFEFDADPSNGWTVDGDVQTDSGETDRAVVFGVERPEILIQETLAWERVDPATTGTTGGMCISLHRPWNAVATGTGTVEIAGEPCDYALDTLESGTAGRPLNQVDLGKKPHAGIMAATNSSYDDLTNATYPIWRLRITSTGAGGGTQYVRFDTNTAGANELVVSGTGAPGTALESGAAKPKLPMNTTYTFFSGTTVNVGASPQSFTITGSSRQALTAATFRVTGGPEPPFADPVRSATIFLERLANPSIPATAAIWTAPPLATSTTTGTMPQQYVVVDSATMSVINTGTQPPPQQLTSRHRNVSSAATAPWQIASTSAPIVGTFPTLTSSTTTAWMPWPNRPFVSSAELTLVPRGHALGMLQNYAQLTPAIPTGTAPGALGIPIAPQLLFDAVHVPSRFAGVHQTYAGDLSGSTGIFSTGSNAITTVNQLSSFREPGRVNLNTVPSEDVWNAVVAGPLATSATSAVGAGFGITVSGTQQAVPARSMYQLLTLSGTGTTIRADAHTPSSLEVNLNPLHGIYTATRLANTTTTRSNVFGVWITLRQSIPNDPDSARYYRAFYIVDRSIPVGFEEGKDHNVWDCVRLRRIIE